MTDEDDDLNTSFHSGTLNRFAPVPRDEPLDESLEGQIHDPLWMLTRQRQFHEFDGSDAGTSVRAEADVEIDPIAAVELQGEDDTDVVTYDGGPLEPLIERERVLDGRQPSAELLAEAGRQFCRLLEREGFGSGPHSPSAFSDTYRLESPDDAVPPEDRRYFEVMADRALDGKALYDDLEAVVDVTWASGTSTEAAAEWVGGETDELPVPDDESLDSPAADSYRRAATAYCEWYAQLYDEPTSETGSAWRPTRLEYDAAVSVGTDSDAARFEVDSYTGGRLEWEDFVPTEAEPPSEEGEFDPPERSDADLKKVPSAMRLPGMPTRRWWEFTSDPVMLEDIVADGTALPYVFALQYTLEYGGNWLRIGVDVPAGSYARIQELELTDSFGVVEETTPVDDEEWQAFTTSFESHERPGLFVPPTVPWSDDSNPCERVIFARDELANLAFGIEETAQGPTGRPVDRREFTPPTLQIQSVTPAEDPDDERVVLANVGDDEFVLDGYSITTDDEDSEAVYTFTDETLAPGESVAIATGSSSDADYGAGEEPVWEDANAVDVYDGDGKLVVRKLLTRPADVSDAYRLVTSVPDHWFPFTMEPDNEEDLDRRDLWYQEEYRLRRAILLDADSIDADIEDIPRPMGELLDPPAELLPEEDETLRLYEEEVTRSGRIAERLDHLVRWSDGTGFLWRGRDVTPGRGELASGLRFDILDDS